MPRRNRSHELMNLVAQAPNDWEVVTKLLKELKKLSDSQFRMFNLSLTNVYAEREARAANKYNVGDVVKFTARGGIVIYARVTGFGRKRLMCQEVTPKDHLPMLRRWKVPASFCTLVPAAKPTTKETT